MRRALVALVRWLAEALVRLYYPTRAIEGAERLPPEGRPVIFVANHANALLDPMLVRVLTGRPVRFLAKSTLFANPFGRLAMDAFGSIPVYRAHEAGTRAGHASRNEETFARCRAELAAGGALALFPEGVSHSDPQLRPLKTGAARIALSAEAEHEGALGVTLVPAGLYYEKKALFPEGTSHSDPQLRPLKTGAARIALSAEAERGGAMGLTIVPIGLYYERKARFRSRVLAAVGQPLPIAPRLGDYGRDERAAVDALTDEIRASLDAVVLQAETRELLEGVSRVARWTADAGESGAPEDLAARHRRARELLAAYETLRARDPARVEAIAAQARAYADVLRRLGVRNPWALEVELISPGAVAIAMAKLAGALPLALVGAVMGFVPYRLAGRLAARVTRDEDVLGTVKLLAGASFLTVAWALEATAVALALGARWAAPTFVAGVATGYVALRFEELWREAAEAGRLVVLRAFHQRTTQRLAERRRALADAVARGLRDAA